ncbi:hypothetical protein GCM10007276_05590 [Agaricicola taiwanensis]|uniref:Uncharacterized protein n=1 Tax=Agaricicola taiwanensis TaxID=591372 RepID=A0A8J2VLA2_9RHOB|nr:hypothetical protein [Agaricicola taiwanensis]GGE31294.1 hypothetical protein GCM10007276_05590 [Agaricicola taiwanensis]
MCGFYAYEDGNKYRPLIPPSPALAARTRLVEAGMTGDPVPEAAWDTFFKPTCGAIPMDHFQRMFQARRLAVAYLAVQAPVRRPQRHASSFRCAEGDEVSAGL